MKKFGIFITVVLLFSVFVCSCSQGMDKNDLTLNETELVLNEGESEKLELKKDGIVVISGIEWISSDEKTATVKNGIVTAGTKGVAVITATYGESSVTCNVTVNSAEKTGLSQNEIYLSVGDEEVLYFEINGKKQTEGVIWRSSDSTVATAENGKVKCVDKGVSTITAEYNGMKYSCRVEVNASPVGNYVANVSVNEMDGARFIFDLTLNADKTYEYSRRDSGVKGESGYIEGETGNVGTWAFEKGGVIKFAYAGGEMRMKVSASSALESVGEIVTGGMDSQMTFKKI